MSSAPPDDPDRSLIREIALTGGDLDRLGHRRSDAAWLETAAVDPFSRHVWLHRGRVLVIDDGMVGVTHEGSIVEVSPESRTVVLLGSDPAGTTYFGQVVAGELESLDEFESSGVHRWAGLREIGTALSDRDAALVATTLALANWHDGHQRCPRCGGPTRAINAGWARQCAEDGSIHFPRTDPSVIMLVIDDRDRALLGRREDWPPGWFSTLAGFVEAGESAEAAVVREVAEETSVSVDPDSLVYLGSQPWPFPSSLMLGYHARALDPRVRVDGQEIAEARWFSREDLRRACADGTVRLPPSVSISRRLVERWYGGDLPTSWDRP